ncbi:MAG: hypothetical protein ACK5QB_01090, partial [Pseudanabaena sp.]
MIGNLLLIDLPSSLRIVSILGLTHWVDVVGGYAAPHLTQSEKNSWGLVMTIYVAYRGLTIYMS